MINVKFDDESVQLAFLRVCNDYRAPQLLSKIGFTLTRKIYPKTRQGLEVLDEKRTQQDQESR